jgi:hypothetical protein
MAKVQSINNNFREINSTNTLSAPGEEMTKSTATKPIEKPTEDPKQ